MEAINFVMTIFNIKNISFNYNQVPVLPGSVFVTAILLLLSLRILAGAML